MFRASSMARVRYKFPCGPLVMRYARGSLCEWLGHQRLKASSGLLDATARPHRGLSGTQPSETIKAAKLTSLEAWCSTDRCRAGELQHCRRAGCARRQAGACCTEPQEALLTADC